MDRLTIKTISPEALKELRDETRPFLGRDMLNKKNLHKVTKKARPVLAKYYPGQEDVLTQDLLDVLILHTKKNNDIIKENKKKKEKLDEAKSKKAAQQGNNTTVSDKRK